MADLIIWPCMFRLCAADSVPDGQPSARS